MNQVINTMSMAMCSKNRRSEQTNKNICPQYKITIFGSLQSQKDMKLGLAKINLVPLRLGISHEGEKDKYFLQKIMSHMLDGAESCCFVGQNLCLSQNDFRKIARQNSSDISPIGNPNNRTLSPRLQSKSQCQKKKCKGSFYRRKRCMCGVEPVCC
jgi:hypothetical protein